MMQETSKHAGSCKHDEQHNAPFNATSLTRDAPSNIQYPISHGKTAQFERTCKQQARSCFLMQSTVRKLLLKCACSIIGLQKCSGKANGKQGDIKIVFEPKIFDCVQKKCRNFLLYKLAKALG